MRILACGDTAWLVECADADEVARWMHVLDSAGIDDVDEVVPAARTLLVRTHRGALTRVREALTTLEIPCDLPETSGRSQPVEIEVVYDGQDLDEVGQLTGLGARGVIETHTGQVWRVAFSGFAPGFGYLVAADPDDTRLHVPRRAEPRTKVPAGAVGLAGEFTGCYPRQSPGGWQLIGHTGAALWDLERDPPALLAPDTYVRFVAR